MNFGSGSSIPDMKTAIEWTEIMSANSPDMERSRNPTLFGGDGLYDAEEANLRLPMLFALCGVAWLLVSLTRQSVQG
jgi:hypothetical protein